MDDVSIIVDNSNKMSATRFPCFFVCKYEGYEHLGLLRMKKN